MPGRVYLAGGVLDLHDLLVLFSVDDDRPGSPSDGEDGNEQGGPEAHLSAFLPLHPLRV
jgi:hypothetical protein